MKLELHFDILHIYSFIALIPVRKHDKHHIAKWILCLDMRSFIVAIYILLFQVKYQNINVVTNVV